MVRNKLDEFHPLFIYSKPSANYLFDLPPNGSILIIFYQKKEKGPLYLLYLVATRK